MELGPKDGCDSRGADFCSCVVTGGVFVSGSMQGFAYVPTDITPMQAPTSFRWVRATSLDWVPKPGFHSSVSPRLGVPPSAFRVAFVPFEAVLAGDNAMLIALASANKGA